MASIDELGKVTSADILIVGGGLAGLTAAIMAKETKPSLDVLVVEKATSGWGGKANKGGGILAYITPEDTVDGFVRFHVKNVGCLLEDQELLGEYAAETVDTLDTLSSFGVNVCKDDDGQYKYVKANPDLPWGLAAADLDMCIIMHKKAKKLGVKFIDKTSIVDLLKEGDRVVGAVGFDIIKGEFMIFKSKATILANGSQNFRIMPMWSCGRGDGIAAAYRAGAQMRNAEFGCFINMIHKQNREVVFGAEDFMYNSKGENISAKVRPGLEADICSKSVVEWYKETVSGNGPVVCDGEENEIQKGAEILFTTPMIWNRPTASVFWSNLNKKAAEALPKDTEKHEVVPGFIGEMSPVRVDRSMATTLQGLYAIGDVSYSGSALTGAVPSPPGRKRGSGLMFALFSGKRAASAAAEYAAGVAGEAEISYEQVQEIKNRIYAPMGKATGIEARQLVWEIQDIMSPITYSIYKSKEHMAEALSKVYSIKEKAQNLKAENAHELTACNEVNSMVLCAEMFYRASMVREESRGWFLREDFPDTNNQKWLKWVIVKDQDGEMKCTLEDIPIERYPIKPESIQGLRIT